MGSKRKNREGTVPKRSENQTRKERKTGKGVERERETERERGVREITSLLSRGI